MIPENFSTQVSIPLDDDGFLDRECPAETCTAPFKVHADDWREKVRDEEVFCPICRHQATSDGWLTQEQIDHCKNRVMAELMPMMQGSLKRMADSVNRGTSRGGLISVSMSYKPSAPVMVLPLDAAELMQQRYECDVCHCRYAAVGAAFFCPACGHNSAKTAFAETIKTIRNVPQVRAALEKGLDRDAAANAYRLLLEENMGKIVGAFQRFAEAAFDALPNAQNFKPRRNLFQNLAESSDLWEQAIGIRYDAMLKPIDWRELQTFFQQRHLIAHKDGLIDDAYLTKTVDRNYHSGQRLVIKEQDVIRFADLIESLAQKLGNVCRSKAESLMD